MPTNSADEEVTRLTLHQRSGGGGAEGEGGGGWKGVGGVDGAEEKEGDDIPCLRDFFSPWLLFLILSIVILSLFLSR
jgi:hypothetical protein